MFGLATPARREWIASSRAASLRTRVREMLLWSEEDLGRPCIYTPIEGSPRTVCREFSRHVCREFPDQESRLMLNQAIAMGRGGVFLNLTDEQYEKLRR